MSIQDLQAMIERNAPENLPYTSDGQMQLTPEEKDYFSRLVSQRAYAAGGAVSKDLTPEQLKSWTTDPNYARYHTAQGEYGGDEGAYATGPQELYGFTSRPYSLNGVDVYDMYDKNGKFMYTSPLDKESLAHSLGKGALMVGATILGGAALNGALAGGTAAGLGDAAGLTELGVEGSAVPLGQVAQTGLTTPGWGSTLSGLGDKVVSAVTNPANLVKYGPAVLGAVSGAVSGTSQPTQTGTGSSGPKDTRSLQNWDWDKLKAEARARGVPLSQLLAGDWSSLTQGAYNKPEVKLASGGALSMLAQGGGSGRDDQIDAKLSDGEYVIDAETTAMIGDGSAKEGAKRLDEMRQNIRKHKGKALAKGKISPNAKSPLQYIKESA